MDQQQPVQAKPVMSFDQKDIAENKLWAAISYLGILFLIPLLVKKSSRFCQEHAKQGAVLFIACLVFYVLGYMPGFGFMLMRLGYVVVSVLSIIGLIKALMGEFWEIPLIGQYRSKINL